MKRIERGGKKQGNRIERKKDEDGLKGKENRGEQMRERERRNRSKTEKIRTNVREGINKGQGKRKKRITTVYPSATPPRAPPTPHPNLGGENREGEKQY